MKTQRLIAKPTHMKKGHPYWKQQNNSYGYTYDYVLVTHKKGEYSVIQIGTHRPIVGATYQYISDETYICPKNDILSFANIKNEFFISNDISDIDQKVIDEIKELV